MVLVISQTGVRPGERIGARPGAKQNSGTILQVLDDVPPLITEVQELTTTDIRDQLNALPFFAPLSFAQREEWLNSNAVVGEGYLEDIPNLRVKVLQLAGKYFEDSLTADQINDLLQRPFVNLQDFYRMLPRKPGSKARRHTLVFRPHNWMVLPEETRRVAFTGRYFDLSTKTEKIGKVTDQRTFILEGGKYALVYPAGAPAPTWEALVQRSGQDPELMSAFRSLLTPHPPSVAKSLLQKCIRTRCAQVEHENKVFPASVATLATFIHLLLHPGAFVPNIQKFVTGLESLTKRLAISIFEDSYYEEFSTLIGLMAASLVAQDDRTWWPSMELIEEWMKVALDVQQEERCFVYHYAQMPPGRSLTMLESSNDTLLGSKSNLLLGSKSNLLLGSKSNLLLGSKSNLLAWSIRIFDTIHGMESDRTMLVSIWAHEGVPRELYHHPQPFFEVMPLIHCIDQHCYTDIAYYVTYGAGITSFCKLFQEIWDLSSAYNPRKADKSTITNLAKYQQILDAQDCIWLRKSVTPRIVDRTYLSETYDFEFEYDQAWIAALVGPLEIKIGTVTALVVIDCTDIHSLTAIRRPSRGNEEAILTNEEKDQAINKAWSMLQSGIMIPPPPTSFPMTGPIRVSYNEGYFLNGQPWEDIRYRRYSYPIFTEPYVSVYTALTTTGEDIAESADEIFEDYLNSYPTVLQRLLYYLADNSSFISSPKIGRDGKGLEIPVYGEDVSVHYLLSFICCLYPAALRSESSGFAVTNGALLTLLKQRVRSRLLALTPPLASIWKSFTPYPRPLWQHQQEIIDNLQRRHEAQEQGSIIWLAMGMGKTACVLSYLAYLVDRQEMPDYCLYTLPPSATDSIAKECELMNIPHQLIDPRSNSDDYTLTPGCINFVVHDHLRLGSLMAQVRKIGPNLLFIVDEFHKTMNPTIRTGLALEIAHVAREFIALSGSIMTSEPEQLIQWLKLIVPFEVTNKNYMVAIGALVSRRVVTGIKVREIDHTVSMANDHPYYRLVPPTLGGSGTTIKFLEAVKESYQVVVEEVIRLASDYYDQQIKTFICAKDIAQQEAIAQGIRSKRPKAQVLLITSSNPVTLTADKPNNIDVVITTIRLVEGYTLTDRYVAINPLVFSNQASRDQRDARLNRIGQRSTEIIIYNVHAGILTYIAQRYQRIRNLSEALKAFAADVGEDVKQDLLAQLQ